MKKLKTDRTNSENLHHINIEHRQYRSSVVENNIIKSKFSQTQSNVMTLFCLFAKSSSTNIIGLCGSGYTCVYYLSKKYNSFKTENEKRE